MALSTSKHDSYSEIVSLSNAGLLETFDHDLQLGKVAISFFEIPHRQPPVIRREVKVVRVIIHDCEIFNDLGPNGWQMSI